MDEQKILKKELDLGHDFWEMGHEDNERKAAQLAVELGKLQETEHLKWQDRCLNVLGCSRKRKEWYTRVQADILRSLLKTLDWTNAWGWQVEETEKGIILRLKRSSPLGDRNFSLGLEVIGEPKYDFQATLTVCMRAENTLDRLEGRDVAGKELKDNGIVIPT